MSISNCGSDERGKYSGGTAGDQTGREWYIRSWWNDGWNVVMRHPNANTRNLIADMAKKAAENDLIGYDQSQRTTFWQHLKASNYDPAQITIACEADCSSGVAAIVKGAGYRLGDTKMQNVSVDIYTGNERAALQNAGFTALYDSKYLTSDAYLLAGDILINEARHTTINLTNGSMAGNSGSSTTTSSSSGGKLDVDGYWGAATTRRLQQFFGCSIVDGIVSSQWSGDAWRHVGCPSFEHDNTGGGSTLMRCIQQKLGVSADGLCGQDTINALIKHFQSASGATVIDGKLDEGSITIKAMQRALNAGTF